MNEIICPKCKHAFTIDEEGYAAIVKQVHDKEFDKEVQKQFKVLSEAKQKENDLILNKAVSEKENEIARLNEQINSIKTSSELNTKAEIAKVKNEKDEEIASLNLKLEQANSSLKQSESDRDIAIKEAISEKDNEIARLTEQINSIKESSDLNIKAEVAKITNQKDEEIASLNLKLEQANSSLKQSESDRDIAIKEAVSGKDSEIIRLTEQLNNMKESGEMNVKAEVAKITNQKDNEIANLKIQIQQLEASAEQSENNMELAISKALTAEKEKYEKILNKSSEELTKKNEELVRLDAKFEKIKLENELAIKEAVSKVEKERDAQKTEYEAELKVQKEIFENYKNHVIKMSTKSIGESLEQYCENRFNMIRSTAFRHAEFGKDNNSVEGTKGDYIYRENDEEGNEIISIMFEMKNETDSTGKKQKNSEFFDKLDKDRKKKKCEYAILVSMLERDSDLYNQGIVDVSYKYEKMYVIRPQLFIPMITILRDAALNSMEYKRQLAEAKNQEIDITHFEERIEDFKNAFSKNYDLASRQFNTAIKEIDNTIEHLNKVKDNLQKSLNNFRLANNKAQSQLTIKALTKDNDTMIEMFDQLHQDD